METRSLLKVLFVLFLVMALASVSIAGKPSRGGKQGSHHHHHDGEHEGSSDTRSGGESQLENPVAPSADEGAKTAEWATSVGSSTNDEGANKTSQTANASGVLIGSEAVDTFSVPGITEIGNEQDIPDLTALMNTTQSWFNEFLANVSEYIPVNVEYATTVGNYCDPITYNSSYYSVTCLIISAVLFLLGVLFCFFGYRLIKVNLFLIGFAFAAFITYSIVLAIFSSVEEPWVLYVALALGLLAGVVAGIVTICIYHIGLFLIGACVGFLFAWLFLSIINVGYFQDHIYIPFLIAIAAGVVSGIITLAYPKYLVIIGTSALGAFQIAWAIDYYLELGQAVYYLALFAVDRGDLSLCWYSWVVVALCLLLFVTGMIVQILVTGRKHNHKDDFQRGICCGLCKCCGKRGHDDYVPLKEVN